MGIVYDLAYRIGITPWEHAGASARAQLETLLDREESERAAPLGKALDIGCGRGRHTLTLARRGWDATGIDDVPRAVEIARQHAGAQSARFVVGDATDLTNAGIGGGYDFFLDIGCFHGLRPEQRATYGDGVTALSTDAATVLMLAVGPGAPRPFPRGVRPDGIEAALTGWQIVDEEGADTSGMPGPLRKTAPKWYRLRRGGTPG